MPDHAHDLISDVVELLLPFDPERLDRILDDVPELDFSAAAVASFAAAAKHSVLTFDSSRRLQFCRRVAAQAGQGAQAWMVEALLRSIQEDASVLDGINREAVTEILVASLALLTPEYLTEDESEALRGEATEHALTLRPEIAAEVAKQGE